MKRERNFAYQRSYYMYSTLHRTLLDYPPHSPLCRTCIRKKKQSCFSPPRKMHLSAHHFSSSSMYVHNHSLFFLLPWPPTMYVYIRTTAHFLPIVGGTQTFIRLAASTILGTVEAAYKSSLGRAENGSYIRPALISGFFVLTKQISLVFFPSSFSLCHFVLCAQLLVDKLCSYKRPLFSYMRRIL